VAGSLKPIVRLPDVRNFQPPDAMLQTTLSNCIAKQLSVTFVKQNSFCHLASSVRGLRDGERGLLFSLTSVEVEAAITKSATEL
jgi:hypothetical protein